MHLYENFFALREWTSQLFDDCLNWLREDLPLKFNAPGGMVKYRETLAASFFHKFFIHVKNNLIDKGILKVKFCHWKNALLCFMLCSTIFLINLKLDFCDIWSTQSLNLQ